ncbi:MAG: hypothetical protein ACK4V6_11760 [Microthrixaceae bacterium]
MTKQLVLMSAPPATDTSSTPVQAAGPRRLGRLDEETKRIGRQGLSQARAALQEASRRAAERDAARLNRRDLELAERARATRSTSTAPGRTTAPARPASEAA